MPSADRTPIVCQSHGAYTDRLGVTHTMRPGDVVPDDALSCSVDNWIAPASNGFCVDVSANRWQMAPASTESADF